MIVPNHIRYHEEIFSLPGFVADPVLVFGFQDVWMPPSGPPFPSKFFEYPDLNEYLKAMGIQHVITLDHFDPRSDLRHDMNDPIDESEHDKYSTFVDIGCLEHVFDTRVCLENCLRMVKPGGHYMLHTCVNGYFAHGLHVFHPDGLLSALELNGFDIIYRKFSGMDGTPLETAEGCLDVLLWIVAKKTASMGRFVCPQQGKWSTRYLDVNKEQS